MSGATAEQAAIPQFGQQEPGADYLLRPGGYVVVVRGAWVAVLDTPSGVMLPGGGCEAGEDAAAAAVREAREECGLRIALQARLGTADELVFSASEQTHFRKRCTFFRAALLKEDGGGEPGYVLHWVAPSEAIARLRHDSQRWAVASVAAGPSAGD
jgi:8-oxo-dGTP pyrophosphatase MutT (NUDIX family)